MSRARRWGFTLVEMLVAIVILGLVAASLNKIFNAQQRLAVAQVEQASVQATVRNASTIASTELWELSTSPAGVSDIVNFDATGLSYRAMRTLGLACQVSANEVRLRDSFLSQYRSIIPGQDALLIFVERNPQQSSDDSWLQLQITSVSNGSSCGGSGAVRLGVSTIDSASLAGIITDAPIRTFEIMELRPVTVGTQTWLGARSVSGGEAALQPVAGPVNANGIRFTYLDSLGTVTTQADRIRSIRISLLGESDRAARRLQSNAVELVQDSLSTTITLRNTPRP
ncbi:MAG TPA: prepilin-type N-terminal cleavage/methylation domain-containing protein [Gemmatimonadales bacterium]|nr:prepilin-type N-terminal cleavage/methylation domain-containing protein [Gemmatimonadales bacterium]